MKLRFAPSPTGLLHIGNARTLLYNWAYARHHNAVFLLRFDDTDVERSKEEYIKAIKTDLNWLQLDYEQEVRQSQRTNIYEQAIFKLKEAQLLYPCYETKQELDIKRQRQLASGKPPIYDRSMFLLDPESKEKFIQQGRKPHWRFKLSDAIIRWHDLTHGNLQINCHNFSDPILVRENGTAIFTLTGIVDDFDLGVTHIIRGDDHISNTAVQLQIAKGLGLNIDLLTFAHLPLITTSEGANFSKRKGGVSLQELQKQGYESMAIINYLGQLGNFNEHKIFLNTKEFCTNFYLKNFGKSAAKFLKEDLDKCNRQYISQVSYQDIKARLIQPITEKFWQVIQHNINTINEAENLYNICFADINSIYDDREYLQLAAQYLPKEPWSDNTWQEWTDLLKAKTSRSGKALFLPLRQAITGQNHGPKMSNILPFIGRDKTIKRLVD